MFSSHVRTGVGVTSMLVILNAQPAPCQRPTGFFDHVEKAQWNAVFVGFESEFQFERVNELSRCMWMASGHLGNHNQKAFEYRKQLGPSDWAAAESEARSAEQFRTKAGEFLLNAAIMVARGDYISAWRLSGSGLKILHADTLAIAKMDQYEVAAALRIH